MIGVFIIIFCVTAAMLFWDCCKLRSSWKAAVSLAAGEPGLYLHKLAVQ